MDITKLTKLRPSNCVSSALHIHPSGTFLDCAIVVLMIRGVDQLPLSVVDDEDGDVP